MYKSNSITLTIYIIFYLFFLSLGEFNSIVVTVDDKEVHLHIRVF